MVIKGIKDEDFVNYRKPSMFIIFPNCSFKCDHENNCRLCQNSHLAHVDGVEAEVDTIIQRYINNPITQAIVCGGLEPFDNFDDLCDIIHYTRFKYNNKDDIVIYTGYTEEEIKEHSLWHNIFDYENIIIKYGRFRPNQEPHYDEVLGVNLVSDNQYAKRYNYEA